MAREIGKLSALAVSRAKEPGMYCDGGGLFLRVGPTGARSWVFRYMLARKRRDMGLGPLHAFSLAEARVRAQECRKLLADGIDPLAAREAARDAARLEAARAISFRQCAEAYIEAHAPGWKNAKHGDQWRNTLAAYAYPVIGELPVNTVDTGLVMKVLEPVWSTKTETASRVRGRMEAVLDWATVRGHRQGDNPARWRGHLDHLLPARSKVQRVEHHAALPYEEIGDFMAELRGQGGTSAKALELLILTATRTSETIGATWAEIDLAAKAWTIPAARMKAGREHRVPLSPRAVDLLTEMKKAGQGDAYVFPGPKPKSSLSNMALLALLKRMGRTDLTAHGFRSTFRDWCAERTSFPRDVAEMALAHAIGDKVEAAYRRGDLYEKRTRLMEAWATYCATAKPAGQVVPIAKCG